MSWVETGIEIYTFKAKDSKINPAPSFLCNVPKDVSVGNIRKTG